MRDSCRKRARPRPDCRHQVHPIRVGLLLLVILLSGCKPKIQIIESKTPPQAPGHTNTKPLRVLVVEDTDLATVARREWSARSDREFELSEMSVDEFRQGMIDDQISNVDVVIYPASMIGALAEGGRIQPMPSYVRRGQFAQNDFAVDDLLPTIRDVTIRWGESTFAVPFGQPVLMLGYRKDVLDTLGAEPPATWQELNQLVQRFSESQPDQAGSENWPTVALAQPLASGWAGQTLLARAAAYAKNRSRYSTLFDLRTMDAMIGSAAFVRALDELIADNQANHASPLDPAQCVEALIDGQAAIAIGWPPKRSRNSIDDNIRFVPLPGAKEIYSISSQQWKPAPDGHVLQVTFLPRAGRIGSLMKSSRRQRAAWSLLVRLTGREWGLTVSSASPHTAVYRTSQLSAASRWIGKAWGSDAVSGYSSSVAAALSNPEGVSSPRILHYDDYLQWLERHTQKAIAGEQSAAEALAATANEWNQLTDQIGRSAQSIAYHHDLGIEP